MAGAGDPRGALVALTGRRWYLPAASERDAWRIRCCLTDPVGAGPALVNVITAAEAVRRGPVRTRRYGSGERALPAVRGAARADRQPPYGRGRMGWPGRETRTGATGTWLTFPARTGTSRSWAREPASATGKRPGNTQHSRCAWTPGSGTRTGLQPTTSPRMRSRTALLRVGGVVAAVRLAAPPVLAPGARNRASARTGGTRTGDAARTGPIGARPEARTGRTGGARRQR